MREGGEEKKEKRERERKKEGAGKKGRRRAGGPIEATAHLCGPVDGAELRKPCSRAGTAGSEAHAACPAVSTGRPCTGRPGSARARLSLAGCQGAPGRGIATWCRGDTPGLFSQGAVQAAGCFPFPYYSEKEKKKKENKPLPYHLCPIASAQCGSILSFTEYNCVKMLHYFLLYKEVSQLHVYIYPSPLGPPFHHPHPSRSFQNSVQRSLCYTPASH